MCTLVYMYHLWSHMEARSPSLGFFLIALHLETRLLTETNVLPSQVGWLTSELQVSAYLCPLVLSAELLAQATNIFYGFWESELRIPYLSDRTFTNQTISPTRYVSVSYKRV